MLLRGNLSRHRSLLLRSLDVTTTTATTIAAIAAVATAVATAVAPMATAVAAVAARVATIAAIAAIATAAAMAKRHRLAVTADQGDANDREKHRQTKNNDTIHPQILQLLTGTVSENYRFCRHDDAIAIADGSASRCDRPLQSTASFHPEAVPVVKIYGLRRICGSKRLGRKVSAPDGLSSGRR
jgi:hypothetical protein